jgi:hypothetical protein
MANVSSVFASHELTAPDPVVEDSFDGDPRADVCGQKDLINSRGREDLCLSFSSLIALKLGSDKVESNDELEIDVCSSTIWGRDICLTRTREKAVLLWEKMLDIEIRIHVDLYHYRRVCEKRVGSWLEL